MKRNSTIIKVGSKVAEVLYRLTGRLEVVGVVLSAAMWLDGKLKQTGEQ